MIRVLKDSYRLSLLIAALFFVSSLFAAYILYRLPSNLMLPNDFQPVFTKTYLVIAMTFILGSIALFLALRTQREIIVYKDRSLDNTSADNNTIVDENKTTITLDGVKASIQQAGTSKEILKAGLQSICKQLEAGQGALYLMNDTNGQQRVELKYGYALGISESSNISFDLGEGLIGQCALSGETLYVDDVPEGYIKIISGLGSASPKYLLIVPVKRNENIAGVMEIASFTPISNDQRKFAEESASLLSEIIK
jgi:putative methionine-R-sulfoxide reductase with GAF domain